MYYHLIFSAKYLLVPYNAVENNKPSVANSFRIFYPACVNFLHKPLQIPCGLIRADAMIPAVVAREISVCFLHHSRVYVCTVCTLCVFVCFGPWQVALYFAQERVNAKNT
jgi:hypothetical protein